MAGNHWINGIIGVRFARNCHPDDLWKTYFTSSKYVQEYRKEYGEPDIIEVRQTFNDNLRSREWEDKVLRRLNAVKSDKWLNRNRAGKKFYNAGFSQETKSKMSDARKRYIKTLTEEEREEIFGKSARQRVIDGINPFAGEKGSQFAKERNARWTLNGTNPLSGDGSIQRKSNAERLKNKTHNFLDKEWRNKENLRRKENEIGLFGMKNPNNTKISCLYCHTETGLPTFSRWHGDNCKYK